MFIRFSGNYNNNVLRQKGNYTWYTSAPYISVYNLYTTGEVLRLTDCVMTYRPHVFFTEKFSVDGSLVYILAAVRKVPCHLQDKHET